MSTRFWARHEEACQIDRYCVAANVLSTAGSLRAARLLQGSSGLEPFQSLRPQLPSTSSLLSSQRNSSETTATQHVALPHTKSPAIARGMLKPSNADCSSETPHRAASTLWDTQHAIATHSPSQHEKKNVVNRQTSELEMVDYGLNIYSEASNAELSQFGLIQSGSANKISAQTPSTKTQQPPFLADSSQTSQSACPAVSRRKRVRHGTAHEAQSGQSLGSGFGSRITAQSVPEDVRLLYSALTNDGREIAGHPEASGSRMREPVSGGSHQSFAFNRPIRARIIELTGTELLHVLKARVFAGGLILRAGKAARASRGRMKLLCTGLLIMQRRSWLARRASTRLFALGLAKHSTRVRQLSTAGPKIFVLGLLIHMAGLQRKGRPKSTRRKGAHLHWNTNVVSKQISGSVFDRSGRRASVMLPGGSTIQRNRGSLGLVLDADSVQKAAEQFKRAQEKTNKVASKKSRQSKMTFFSGSAARNYGIALTRCNNVQPFQQLADALLSMNVADITAKDLLDTLAQLDIYGDTAAIGKVRQYQGDPKLLEIPDLFVLHVILKVPHTLDRIKSLAFMMTQTDNIQHCQKTGSLILKCCRTVRHSGALADVLGIMLRLGKEIQAATGGDPDSVSGFKVTSLCDLMKSKSRGGRSFGELLVEALLANASALPDVNGELEPMMRIRVASLTLDSLNQEVSAMEGARKRLQSLSSELFGPALSSVQQALQASTQASKTLNNMLQSVAEEYGITCQFLLESPKTPPPVLFGALQQFVNAFSKEVTKVAERIKRQSRSGAGTKPQKSLSEGSAAPDKKKSLSRGFSLSLRKNSTQAVEALPVPPSHRPAPPPKAAKRKASTSAAAASASS